MRKIFLIPLILTTKLCLACDNPSLQTEMSNILFKDREFTVFTCGAIENCDPQEMKERMIFTKLKSRYISSEICLAETSSSVKNRYTGIFIIRNNIPKLNMTVFDTGIKIKEQNGKTNLVVDLVTDNATGEGESDVYEWNGRNFRFVTSHHIPPVSD